MTRERESWYLEFAVREVGRRSIRDEEQYSGEGNHH